MTDITPAELWLQKLQTRLREDFSVTPVVATEIEFYLVGAEEMAKDAWLLARLEGLMQRENIPIHLPEKERAQEQFEIALRPTADLLGLARHTQRLKSVIFDDMASIGLTAHFAAKPLPDRAGSGLHLHLHLENEAGENLFKREEAGDYSAPLQHALGGLIAVLPASLIFFAPQPESYARFTPETRAPTHIAWGPNNRTAALRLPPKPLNDKHLEHRVPGADADPALAIGALLMGVHWGLEHQLAPPEAVHGEVHHAAYGLKLLPQNLEEARALYKASWLPEHYPLI